MKKILMITLVDNRVIETDMTDQLNKAIELPIGAPANHPFYQQICTGIAVSGYPDVSRESETTYTHIAPSQIKEVTFKLVK